MLEGVAVGIWNVITVSARQALVPAELFGRVNSVYRFGGWGVLPLGAPVGGVVARSVGEPAGQSSNWGRLRVERLSSEK